MVPQVSQESARYYAETEEKLRQRVRKLDALYSVARALVGRGSVFRVTLPISQPAVS